MGTKSKPGAYDCYTKLAPNEPFFILRAQDQLAPDLVREWAARAEKAGCPAEKVAEARALAEEMEGWPDRKMPD